MFKQDAKLISEMVQLNSKPMKRHDETCGSTYTSSSVFKSTVENSDTDNNYTNHVDMLMKPQAAT